MDLIKIDNIMHHLLILLNTVNQHLKLKKIQKNNVEKTKNLANNKI